ncbi:hypothetical protein FRX31_035073, partial [Thalictrum thalictroides]
MNNELGLSNICNVDKNIIAEVEEDSSDHDEDDMIDDSNVELDSNLERDDEDDVVDDPAGPSSIPNDEDEIEVIVGGRISEAAMRLIRKERRSFPEIRCRYQIVSKRIEMSLVDKNIPDVDDDHSILLLEGQLKSGARLPLSKFVCDVLNNYNKAPINMASSFWHAMRVMDELRSMFHYNIEVAD